MDGQYFLQDSAAPHVANGVKQLLKRHFKNARISNRLFPTTRLARSPDLNPFDFRLWDYLMYVLISTLIPNVSELKIYIAQHILKLIPFVEHAVFLFNFAADCILSMC